MVTGSAAEIVVPLKSRAAPAETTVPADVLPQPGHPQPCHGHDPPGRQHVQRFREDAEVGMAVGHEGPTVSF